MKHSECNNEMECISDFAGNDRPGQVGRWADWCPVCKVVEFGGYWGIIPDLPSDEMLDEEDPKFDEYVREWAPKCKKAYEEWLNHVDEDEVQDIREEVGRIIREVVDGEQKQENVMSAINLNLKDAFLKESHDSSNAMVEKAKKWIEIAKERHYRYGSMKSPTPPYPSKEELASAGHGYVPNSNNKFTNVEIDADKLKQEHPVVYDWLIFFMTSGGFDRVNNIFPLRYWNDEFWAQAAFCMTFERIDKSMKKYLERVGFFEYAPEFFFWMLMLMPDGMGHHRFIRWYGNRATDEMKWYVLKNYENGITYIGNPTEEMNDYAREKDPEYFRMHEFTSRITDEIIREGDEEEDFMDRMNIRRDQVLKLNPKKVGSKDKEVYARLVKDAEKDEKEKMNKRVD